MVSLLPCLPQAGASVILEAIVYIALATFNAESAAGGEVEGRAARPLEFIRPRI